MARYRNVRRRSRSAALFLALVAWGGAALSEDTFRPALSVCNRTLQSVFLAMSYDLAGTVQSTSKGWYAVQPCTCRTLLHDTPLRATELFLSAIHHLGDANLLQPAQGQACVKDVAFQLMPRAAGAAACTAAGGHFFSSKWYDTGGRDLTVNLTAPGQCNLMGDH